MSRAATLRTAGMLADGLDALGARLTDLGEPEVGGAALRAASDLYSGGLIGQAAVDLGMKSARLLAARARELDDDGAAACAERGERLILTAIRGQA